MNVNQPAQQSAQEATTTPITNTATSPTTETPSSKYIYYKYSR
jgi:hypothetical protein